MTPSFSLDRVGFWLDYTVWLDIISVIPFYVDLASGGSDEQGIPLTIAHNNYHLASNPIYEKLSPRKPSSTRNLSPPRHDGR